MVQQLWVHIDELLGIQGTTDVDTIPNVSMSELKLKSTIYQDDISVLVDIFRDYWAPCADL